LTTALHASLRVLSEQLVRPMLEFVVSRTWKAVLHQFKVRELFNHTLRLAWPR